MADKPHTPLEDAAIIRLYNARDERAISETDRKYGGYCMTVSMNILDSYPDAEECVNDTYLHTWRSIPPQNPASLRNFLGKIIRNLSINRHRALHSDKRNRDLEVSLSELESCLPVPDGENGGSELSELLNEFLGTQTPTDRKIFVQRYWYNLSAAEISEEHDISENAVWVKLHRTRERLREFLTERGYKL